MFTFAYDISDFEFVYIIIIVLFFIFFVIIVVFLLQLACVVTSDRKMAEDSFIGDSIIEDSFFIFILCVLVCDKPFVVVCCFVREVL